MSHLWEAVATGNRGMPSAPVYRYCRPENRVLTVRGLVIAALFVTLFGLSGALGSESYLIVDLGPPSSDPVPTYIGVETPRMDWRSRQTRKFTHLALDGRLTLIRLSSGRYRLSHFDFTETPRGDKRTAYLPSDWRIHIYPESVHYLGPKTFVQSDPTEMDTVMALELLCGSFPLEISGLHEFHFLHYNRASTPIKYSCKPGTNVHKGESPD
jgi:hypothetical protein